MKTFLILATLASSIGTAQANVSLKNGNFFIGYVDLVYTGGFEPKIERVYNSKTLYRGFFGWGWGTEYEVSLGVGPDGSVTISEYGGGASNRFVPIGAKAEDVASAVAMIVKAAKDTKYLTQVAALDAYKKRLAGDANFRTAEWERFRREGKVQPRLLKDGTQLISNRFSYQYVTKVAGGYLRSYDTGRTDRFDDRGRLVKVQDKNNNSIELSYAADGKLQKLQDNFNRKIFFTFDNRGRLAKLQGENSKETEYRYNDKDELIYSKDVDGNVYQYKYTSDGKHYLTEIGYSDKTSLQIAYWSKDKLESVKSVRERDGALTEYDYMIDPKQKGHITVKLVSKSKEGSVISNSSYEYLFKYKPDGEEWTYRMITQVDGQKTETTYNECCGLPLLIKRGSDETAFEYDKKGRVTKKSTPSEVTELAYHPKANKVSKVVRYPKGNKKVVNWSEFQYDDKGNLSFAKNSGGKGVKLFYDANGRIKSLLDQNKRRLDFKYNENSKPIEISDPSLGSITVSYNNSGEIKKVESSAGRKIALEVTTAFQNLVDIIKPAGVSLSF
ncbi:MAG: hypothetical protein JNL01_04900 [Bdellovibrionales bacterium]|nr:hypothetical protein [Bdellovibrionales bacterium]